jgi:hypothetical protein
MKRLLIILGVLTSQVIHAQIFVSTDARTVYNWDSIGEEWILEESEDDFLTFFEFNNELTMIKHTTPSVTSAYLIKSVEVDDEDGRDQIEYDVISDVGNSYMLLYDAKNENIRFIDFKSDRMIRFEIKAVWTEE